ncbi:MAG: GNAT family N-acetyltransferase [Firmicutes bacterium]|nr:GNAT family N-acetyltransferase [Bacillota bacterium]
MDATRMQADSEAFLESVGQTDEYLFVLWFRNTFAGLIGLKNPDRINHKVEIGYWLNPVCEGNGIITLSCQKLIAYAFGELEMNRILIQVATGNQKSRRIPERLGFREEGIEREGELLVSGYTDIVRYGLLKREFNGNN